MANYEAGSYDRVNIGRRDNRLISEDWVARYSSKDNEIYLLIITTMYQEICGKIDRISKGDGIDIHINIDIYVPASPSFVRFNNAVYALQDSPFFNILIHPSTKPDLCTRSNPSGIDINLPTTHMAVSRNSSLSFELFKMEPTNSKGLVMRVIISTPSRRKERWPIRLRAVSERDTEI